MENVDVDVLSMPDSQQLKAPQQMDEDEDIDQETSVNLFNLDSVIGQVFQHRKKIIEGEFDGDDADDEEDNNPIAVTELDEEISSEDMADFLKNLHIRTQHLVGKVTVNGMSRLAATNHVATALTRFKGKVRLDTSGKRATSADENSLNTDETQSTTESPETPTTPPATEIESQQTKGGDETENPTQETAVRSKKISKQSSKTEMKPLRRRETSNITSGTNKAASIIKTAKPHPSAATSLPAKTVADIGGARKTSHKVKPAVKSVRSGIKSKVIH